MPGTYSLVKTVVTGETITAADRNTEHTNHITNADPDGIGDASADVAEMQATADPYPASSESLATNDRGETQRIRYLIKQITGQTQWYIDPGTIAQTIPGDKTFSGETVVAAAQPRFELHETDATADEGYWRFRANTDTFYLQTLNDARDAPVTIITIPRTGTTPNYVSFAPYVKANAGIQTDGVNTLKTKIIDIGDWNMDSTASVNIAHGLTLANIRSVVVNVRDDTTSSLRDITNEFSVDSSITDGAWSLGSTNVTIERVAAGGFDSAGYNATSFNRGWITITYVA